MRKLREIARRGTAALLSVTLCVGMIGVPVFAVEDESESPPEVQVTYCGLEAHEHTEAC